MGAGVHGGNYLIGCGLILAVILVAALVAVVVL